MLFRWTTRVCTLAPNEFLAHVPKDVRYWR